MIDFKKIHSVVIVGASEDPKKIGNIIIAKNREFEGNLYGINPKGGSAYGFDFYTDFPSLPEVPDIAVFAIPEFLIYDALESAGKLGIKKAIIITAGFKEIGKKDEEIRLHTIAGKYGIRFLGPNCLGYGDTFKGLNLSFGGNFFEKGNIGIISQSGAMAVAITDILDSRSLGFSTFFSLGNKTDIDESDLLLELLEDPNTKVIALYLESIARGDIFLETLKKVTHKKPVIVMIGGVSDLGKRATSSHTGSLSGDQKMYEAAFSQGGALLTYSLEEFFDLLEIFSLSGEKTVHGNPFLITNAGGIGVLATDQCSFHGLEIASIDPEEDKKLRLEMPLMMSTKNPIDIIGDADSVRVRQILENISEICKKADILFFFTIQATTDMEKIAEEIIIFQKAHPDFQIFVGLIGGETVGTSRSLLTHAGIFVADTPESLIGSYSALLGWRSGKIKTGEKVLSSAKKSETSALLLDQNQTEQLLSEYKLSTSQTYQYADLESILKHTDHFSGPYILKIAGKSIAHKSDIGGVIGSVSSPEEVQAAYAKILENTQKYIKKSEIDGVTIGKYIVPSPSLELFFGAKRDPNFGPTFIIGAGGIYLTVLDDTRIYIGKWDKLEIRKTIQSLRSYPAISGYRKQKVADLDILISTIDRLSTLFLEHPEIKEIDINPILFEDGKAVIADAKIYI